MRITWYGLSCFYLEGKAAKVLMDPFDTTVGYAVPAVYADVWTCSHDHYDHNYKAAIINAAVADGVDGLKKNGISITAVKTFHDMKQGAEWGENTMFVVEIDGLRIAHSGDLGHELSSGQMEALGRIDILLITTGGIFTIGAAQAARVSKAVGARLTIPMHYATPHLRGFELEQGIDDFIAGVDCECVNIDSNVLEIDCNTLPDRAAYILTLA